MAHLSVEEVRQNFVAAAAKLNQHLEQAKPTLEIEAIRVLDMSPGVGGSDYGLPYSIWQVEFRRTHQDDQGRTLSATWQLKYLEPVFADRTAQIERSAKAEIYRAGQGASFNWSDQDSIALTLYLDRPLAVDVVSTIESMEQQLQAQR